MMVTPITRRIYAESGTTPPLPSLDDIALHLAKRISSRQADETLAIAGLFDQDASAYVPLDSDHRMAKLLNEHNGGKVPYDILFLDSPKLPIEGFTWAPKSFMKRQLNIELKGTYDGAMGVITEQGLLGQYFCLVLQNEWGDDGPPQSYRIRIDNSEHLVVLFAGNIDPDKDGLPLYNVLVLLRAVEKGEEFLAVGSQLLESMEVGGGDGDNVLRVKLVCYVHVFKKDRNETWNALPVTNYATSSNRLVLLS